MTETQRALQAVKTSFGEDITGLMETITDTKEHLQNQIDLFQATGCFYRNRTNPTENKPMLLEKIVYRTVFWQKNSTVAARTT
jgi:hypothetical protein